MRVDSDGKEYDDSSGGQSCADAHKESENNLPSYTVKAKMPTIRDLAAEAGAEHLRKQFDAWLQRQRQRQDVPLPSNAVAIADHPAITSLPVACGGGVYGYLGQEVDGGAVNGFVGAIAELDSEHGASAGGLAELGGGAGVVAGAGVTATLGINGGVTKEGLVYGGVGAHTPLVSASAGGVAFGHGIESVSGIGLYGEAFLLQKGGGAGVYINLSTVGRGCR